MAVEQIPAPLAPLSPVSTSPVRRHGPYVVAAFTTGLLVNLGFARLGFMPLDASIVFDGGWRILNGQVPWRDFVTPYGVTPAMMQAAFFAAGGTTWLAFCLHSSVVNGAFAAVLYLLLAVLRLPRPLALFYALCAGFFFYPMVGVPFIDQHSFFFTLAAIAAAVAGNFTEGERLQWWLWASVPPLALLAFFSKQVPFAFASPALPLLFVLPATARYRTRLSGLGAGVLACAAAALLLTLTLRIPWGTLIEYTLVRPREVGALRASGLSPLATRVAQRYDNLPAALGLDFIGNAVFLYRALLAALPFVLGVWIAARRRGHDLTADVTRLTCALLLAPLTYVSSLLLGFVTNNQTQNSVAFYPVGAALLHAAMCAALRILEHGLSLLLAAQRIPGIGRAAGGFIRPSMLAVLVGLSIAPVRHWTLDTSTWVTQVDMPRMVNDMTFDFALAARSASSLPDGMQFLRWTPSPATYDLAGWSALVSFLRATDGNVLIIGDTLVTYGLARRPSVAPNLWFHPGLALPDPAEPAFAAYEQELIDRIARFKVRYIVVEGEQTRLGFTIGQLPRLSAMLAAGWTVTHTFGPNRVYEATGGSPDGR